jgi:alkyl hydroperoxide reductase subunit F
VEIGLLPNNESFKDLVELNEQGEVIVDCSCQTSVEGVFGAGDVTTVPHKQIVIAAGEGAKAALSAYNYLTNKSFI